MEGAMMHMQWRAVTIATMGVLLTVSPAAVRAAGFPMTAATTPTVDGAALFVGKEEGIFEKHGIDMKISFMSILAYAPPALISDSIQTAAVPATVFLQAIEGGLDLVAISGATVTSKEIPNTGCLAGFQSGIKTPQDFIGKKVAVPGLFSVIQINFEEWLSQKGVDPGKVNYFELGFPQMPDALKSGKMDAVCVVDPIMSQIISNKIGYMASDFLRDLDDGHVGLLYVSTRAWAEGHPKELAEFRAAVKEASSFVYSNPDKARQDFETYVKLPAEILKTMAFTKLEPNLTADQLTWWVTVMKRHDALHSEIDLSQIIQK